MRLTDEDEAAGKLGGRMAARTGDIGDCCLFNEPNDSLEDCPWSGALLSGLSSPVDLRTAKLCDAVVDAVNKLMLPEFFVGDGRRCGDCASGFEAPDLEVLWTGTFGAFCCKGSDGCAANRRAGCLRCGDTS